MNYPMYGNNQMYMQDLQAMRDRIDAQMRQLQQPLAQQTPAINQTFQLSNSSSMNDFDGKYAKDLDEVKNTLTLKTTYFTDKEMKTLWVKNASGEIKTYTLSEVIELDPKDKEIFELKKQIEEMKGMILNARNDNENVNGTTTIKKSTDVSNDKSSNAKGK
ncbi:MAG: hypothetical protein ACI4VQ_06410 [Clostridia bacterium]